MTEAMPPRDFGDLFTQTFRIAFRMFFKLLTIYLMFLVPIGVAQLVLEYDADLGEMPIRMFFALAVLFVWPIPRAAGLMAVTDRFTGNTTSIRRCYRVAFRKAGTLIGISIVVSVLTVFGLVLFIIPGLIVLAAFSVATEAAVVEDLPMRRALGRSRELTRGRRIFIVFFLGVLALTVLVPKAVVSGVMTWFFDEADFIAVVVNQFTDIVFTLIMGVATACLYLDLRVRESGLTARELADRVEELEEGMRPPPPPSAIVEGLRESS